MKKTKKTLALFLSASILLSCTACTGGDSSLPIDNIIDSMPEDSSVQSETKEESSIPEESSKPVEETSKPVLKSLSDFTIADLQNFQPEIMENGRNLFGGKSDITEYMHYFENSSTMIFDIDWFGVNVRESTTAMRTELDGGEGILPLLKGLAYISESSFSHNYTSYDISWNDPRMAFAYTEGDTPEIHTYTMSYHIGDEITTRGFIKKDGSMTDFIIDPAYTYGLPLFSDEISNLTFDINGRTVYADTLSFKGELASYRIDDYPELPNDKYVYAEVTFRNAVVEYKASDKENLRGYDNETYIEDITIITEDTDAIIDSGFFMSDVEKDPAMTDTYNVIIKNLDTINKDTTIGMTLLDLDFDGTPELLVADYAEIKEENYKDYGADISVYRILGGELKYIDTIFNSITKPESYSNDLGLKEFSDGTKGWFGTSYKNRKTGELTYDEVDYIYTLEGDTLVAKEIFGCERKEHLDENGDTVTTYTFYHNGKQMVMTKTKNPPEEDMMFEYTYTWNDISSFSTTTLYDVVREHFCKDIEYSYNLTSHWLSKGTNHIELTERELSHNIAYLVDCFYLGEYNPARHNNYYLFMGALAKPVIYLYPEEETEVSVQIDFAGEGEITVSYPDYGTGWNVTAMPDGTLCDRDGTEYYCLYWEGNGKAKLDMSKGFCVSGKDTADFLREKLLYIGLSAREANEFIIYWLPLMQENEYNLISFHTEEYNAAVPMTVTPAPDSLIRVFMTYKPSEEYVEMSPQVLPSYDRNGFTVVEWGGGITE